MDKDLFGRHTPVRPAGFSIRKRLNDDAIIILKYKRSENAELFITLDYSEDGFTLYGLHLSFCLRCGRFIRFGIGYDVCWICEGDLEDDGEW